MSDILNINEAAEFLRISKNSLYALVAAKKVPCRRVGVGMTAPIRFSRDALLRWLEGDTYSFSGRGPKES